MTIYPSALERRGADVIRITWSDQRIQDYSPQALREHCPCASCREKHSAPAMPPTMLPILSLQETEPLRIESMRPVGNYAYAIQFSDGHKNGIFTFDWLRTIGQDIATHDNGTAPSDGAT